jgi:hypothetical protein
MPGFGASAGGERPNGYGAAFEAVVLTDLMAMMHGGGWLGDDLL